MSAAAAGSAWVGADELLYAGSQAQSDSLLMGQDNSMQVRFVHRGCIQTRFGGSGDCHVE
jgi:hypothetical protein